MLKKLCNDEKVMRNFFQDIIDSFCCSCVQSYWITDKLHKDEPFAMKKQLYETKMLKIMQGGSEWTKGFMLASTKTNAINLVKSTLFRIHADQTPHN